MQPLHENENKSYQYQFWYDQCQSILRCLVTPGLGTPNFCLDVQIRIISLARQMMLKWCCNDVNTMSMYQYRREVIMTSWACWNLILTILHKAVNIIYYAYTCTCYHHVFPYTVSIADPDKAACEDPWYLWAVLWVARNSLKALRLPETGRWSSSNW